MANASQCCTACFIRAGLGSNMASTICESDRFLSTTWELLLERLDGDLSLDIELLLKKVWRREFDWRRWVHLSHFGYAVLRRLRHFDTMAHLGKA